MKRPTSPKPAALDGVSRAPITLVLRGDMAAALRVSSFLRSTSPKANALDAIAAAISSEIETWCGGDEKCRKWLLEGQDT